MSRRYAVVSVIQLALLVLYINIVVSKSPKRPKVEYDGKALRVPVNPEGALELYQHWTNQAFSGLFAAIASKRLKESPKHVKHKVEQCSKNAKDVILHAKCVSALLNNEFDHYEKYGYQNYDTKVIRTQSFAQEVPATPKSKTRSRTSHTTTAPLKILPRKKNNKITPNARPLYYNQNRISSETRYYPTNQLTRRYLIRRITNDIIKPNRNLIQPIIIPRASWERTNPSNVRRQFHEHLQDHPKKKYYSNEHVTYNVNSSQRLKKLSVHKKLAKKNKKKHQYEWPGFAPQRLNRMRKRRMKREVIRRNSYELKSRFANMTPFGIVAKMLTKTILAAKNKTEIKPWQLAVERIRDRAQREKEMRKKMKEAEQESYERFAFRGMRREGIDMRDLMDEHPHEFKKLLRQRRLKESEKNPQQRFINLIRDGVKLGHSILGKNTTDFDDKTVKAFSPRLLSVMPEQDDDMIDLLSPSLFSLHDEGKGLERLTSLPNMVKGFSRDDQQSWMNLIMEAAGVNEQVDRIEKDPKLQARRRGWKKQPPINKQIIARNYEKEIVGKDGQPLYFTKENATQILGSFEGRKISTWEKLVRSYSKEQLAEMNRTGYTTLTKEQLYLLYGPESPFNNTRALAQLTSFNSINDLHNAIERDVHRTAMMRSFRIRQKDITLSPIVFTPLTFAYPLMNQLIVLSPVVFSPVIGTPAVLGPIVLSPWLFIPVILSPRVLSPLILNPLIFSPIILSPLVLHPLILSPGVFNPIILSPLVLSPLILSPQVFTPVILSPLVLNPLILNPMLGSPLILSPFVLSPVILSPQALFGVILSPYALSPLIESKLILSTVFLSPSWLS